MSRADDRSRMMMVAAQHQHEGEKEKRKKIPGFDFNPTDEEVVSYFLKRAGMGIRLPSSVESVVRRVDMYGQRAPWEIFAEEMTMGRRVFFAITRLEKRSPGRVRRVVVSGSGRLKGTWKGQTTKERIEVGDMVAEKYTLSFIKETDDEASDQTRKKKKASTHWNMREYRVLSYGGGEGELDQSVAFCRLTYSGPQHRSSAAASSSTWSSAAGDRKRAVEEGVESISRPAKRALVNTSKAPRDGVTAAFALALYSKKTVGDGRAGGAAQTSTSLRMMTVVARRAQPCPRTQRARIPSLREEGRTIPMSHVIQRVFGERARTYK
uniref:NAC domain-containing protein n=1 Tax=Kalanchoe fedtschenkoi TaxID=63787 RepID=A0A7N0U5C5_KALFE